MKFRLEYEIFHCFSFVKIFHTVLTLRKTFLSHQISEWIFIYFTGILRNSVSFNSDITTSQRFYTCQYRSKKGPKLLPPWKLNCSHFLSVKNILARHSAKQLLSFCGGIKQIGPLTTASNDSLHEQYVV